jgi:hypothetical protein
VLIAARCACTKQQASIGCIVDNTNLDIRKNNTERKLEVESASVHKLFNKVTLDYDLACSNCYPSL